MKKLFPSLLLTLTLLPALTACGGYDYTAHISEERGDLFCAETEEFSITLSCVKREHPYSADGIPCPPAMLVEISLVPASAELRDYEVYVSGESEWGGETSFRTYAGDYFYSQSVDAFPQDSVTVRVVWGEESRELYATSVRNENTLSVKDALGCAVKAEKETIDRMTENGKFAGEFYVRLLRRNTNFYYVGIIDKNGETISLLLDSETGEVLARHGN